MAESLSTSDDEFNVETDNAADIAITLERLKEFSFYLVENMELQLIFFLSLLEEREVSSKPNSIYTTVLSKLLSSLPKVGSALGGGLAKGEIAVLEKIDKNNSRKLADLVYNFSDHKEDIRKVLIEASIDIFFSFEHQFMKLSSEGGPKRAMQKLAKDASDRIFNYLLDSEQKKDITRMDVAKGVLLGDSKRNRAGIREGKTVMKDESKWKTCKLYRKTGIVIVDERSFFKREDSKTRKYGHRRLFPWENPEDIKQTWKPDSDFDIPSYKLTVTKDLLKVVRDYVMTKDPFDEAKMERENYNKEALEDRHIKHEEVLETLQDHFKELLEELQRQYKIIVDSHRESKKLFMEMSDNKEKNLHQELHVKLKEIRKGVDETKDLVGRGAMIRKEPSTSSAAQEIDLKDIATEIREQVVEQTREALRRNDPGPRIRNEINRFLQKL